MQHVVCAGFVRETNRVCAGRSHLKGHTFGTFLALSVLIKAEPYSIHMLPAWSQLFRSLPSVQLLMLHKSQKKMYAVLVEPM